MNSALGAAALSICLMGASACAPERTASSFGSSEAMRAQPVAFGEVASIRAVNIGAGQSRMGMVTGAVLGGVGGAALGGDTAGSVAGGLAGAVVGGALGNAIQGSRNTRGIEVTVSLESGETIAIVQPGDVNEFRVGDRVRVIGAADNARVSR